jgi:hypothetical protein
MKAAKYVAAAGSAVTVVACAFGMSSTPMASGSTDGILNGTYDVVATGSNNTMDRWVISTNCTELAKGCEATIESSWVGGVANYQGFNTWLLTLKGVVPVCPDKTTTKGVMVFQWNSRTLQGQLSSMQAGPCQMTRPGESKTPFTLVKLDASGSPVPTTPAAPTSAAPSTLPNGRTSVTATSPTTVPPPPPPPPAAPETPVPPVGPEPPAPDA